MSVAVKTDATVGESVQRTAEALRAAGIDPPRFEATLLVALAMDLPRERVMAHPETQLSPLQHDRLDRLLARRLAREPLAYLRGEQEFCGRGFLVDRSVLIPRPETELLVETALEACARAVARGKRRPLVVDLGTGSGVIAVTVALECRQAHVVGLDVSAAALRVAADNACRLGAANVQFVRADLLAPTRGPIDLLLANLPYVPASRWPTLQPELRYEPPLALLGGPTGLEVIERALVQAREVLASDAELMLEIDEEQAPAALKLASGLFPAAKGSVLPDLAGMDRLLHVRMGNRKPES